MGKKKNKTKKILKGLKGSYLKDLINISEYNENNDTAFENPYEDLPGHIKFDNGDEYIAIPLAEEYLHLITIIDRDVTRGKLASGEYTISCIGCNMKSHDRGDGAPCVDIHFRVSIRKTEKNIEDSRENIDNAYFGSIVYRMGDVFDNGANIKIKLDDNLMNIINGVHAPRNRNKIYPPRFVRLQENAISLYLYDY